jgi:hypothetical protein
VFVDFTATLTDTITIGAHLSRPDAISTPGEILLFRGLLLPEEIKKGKESSLPFLPPSR